MRDDLQSTQDYSALSRAHGALLPKADLVELARDRAAQEYGELCDNFKLLDKKSHATAAVGGIFLAAALAFVNQITYTAGPYGVALIVLLLLLVLLLTASAALSLWSMRAQSIWMPMCSKVLWDRVKPLLHSDIPDAVRHELSGAVQLESIDIHVRVNVWLADTNSRKAGLLGSAQTALLVGSVLASCLAIVRLIHAATP